MQVILQKNSLLLDAVRNRHICFAAMAETTESADNLVDPLTENFDETSDSKKTYITIMFM